MLIGIDASRATAARRTGTENYSLHLIRELLAQGQEHSFRLYFNQHPEADLFDATAERRIMPFPRLWTHLRLSWEMAARAPDVLFVPSHVLPLKHPRRSVVTVHDLGYHYFPEAHTLFQNAYLRWSTQFNARAAARVLADSEATRRDLAHFYRIAEDKVTVVYPGRDETLARVEDPEELAGVRERYGLSQHYLLYVGTLQPRKNLVRLVQAFGRLVSQGQTTSTGPGEGGEAFSDLQLVLAGQKGWLYGDIMAEVKRLGLTGRVILTGYVAAADLPALLSGALAFVYPSLYEGFGLPVLEAMACGVPVVCSNSSSLPEVAGEAALMVDPLDVELLAEGLDSVVRDHALRRELVARGYRQMKEFSWRRCGEQTLHVLKEVSQTRQSGGRIPESATRGVD